MKENKVFCDHCKQEILKVQSMNGWFIELSAMPWAEFPGGFRYSTIDHPPLQRDMQFCNMKCLKEWVS